MMTEQEIEQKITEIAAQINAKYRLLDPKWAEGDSPLKYVSWVLPETIEKSFALAEFIKPKPNDQIFEAGPGTGYLLYILKKLYGCKVSGCDIPYRPIYKEMQRRLGVGFVWDEEIKPSKPIHSLELFAPYDYILATQISFMDNWSVEDFEFFINNCKKHLVPDGSVILFPNPKTLGDYKRVFHWVKAYVKQIYFPHLGRGIVIQYDKSNDA